MIETYQVFSYLHNMMRKDDLAIKLCKEFLKQHPLKWTESSSKEYTAIDEDGRDYIFIKNREGKFTIYEGSYFDGTFPLGLKTKTDSLADAIESANEILFNVDFCVQPYDLG